MVPFFTGIEDINMTSKKTKSKVTKRNNKEGFLFLLPLIVIFIGLLGYSFYFLISNSFRDVTITFRRSEFVGLANYQTIFKDKSFWKSLLNTFILSTANIFCGLTFGFIIAIILNFKIKGKRFFHALFFIPSMLPIALMATVFGSMLEYKNGIVNQILRGVGLAMLSLKAKMSGNEELYESLNAFSKLMQGKIFRDKEIKIKVKEELIECIEKESPDIVITDIQMPEVNGLDVCKYLYETRPETQVIILTAYSNFDYAKSAIKYSACEYVLKIAIMDELPEALGKATGKLLKLKKEVEKEEVVIPEQKTLLQQIEQYVEQNYKSKISLDEIADELHVNRSYLSRFYKNKTGVNLFDEILKLRIESAKEYLLKTDMKTYEVSEAVGFEDAGYFSKMFKKIMGVSPKEFRKREKDEKKN